MKFTGKEAKRLREQVVETTGAVTSFCSGVPTATISLFERGYVVPEEKIIRALFDTLLDLKAVREQFSGIPLDMHDQKWLKAQIRVLRARRNGEKSKPANAQAEQQSSSVDAIR